MTTLRLVDVSCAGQIPLERLGDDRGTAERDVFFTEVFDRNPELRARRSAFEDAFSTIGELSLSINVTSVRHSSVATHMATQYCSHLPIR